MFLPSSQKYSILYLMLFLFCACSPQSENKVSLSHGPDDSAGGGDSYIINTPFATYYLDKVGGGLSSMIDRDGIDWLGFHNKEGTGHKGEYRGFPNAIHKQDGSFFHAMNAKTDSSTSVIEMENEDHVRISFETGNRKWKGVWDFYADHCEFAMSEISEGYHYWVQYEGVPGGEMDSTDFWYASANVDKHLINEPYEGDLPSPEWIAFGDQNFQRVLYMLHHEDDHHPDNYVSRPEMTVFAFGRENKDKFLNTKQTFSIGFVESVDYKVIENAIKEILK